MSTQDKCLVIGANGFIGSHLVDELAESGHRVRAFDHFSRPRIFKSSPSVEILKGDFFEDVVVTEALKDIDYAFHAFSATTPFSSDSDPYSDISVNLMRNVQLFEKAVEAGVKKVIFISTGGAIYGHLAEEKVATELDAPTPVSPYGIVKLASEHYLAYFERKYGLDYRVYRITNPYGPRQITKNNQGVVPAFIDKLKHGEKIIVIGDGSSTRDYIYIKDVARLLADTFSKDSRFNTYNLGSGQQVSVNAIIETLEDIIGQKALVDYVEAPKTFLKQSRVSVERFKNEFGLDSLTPFKEGLEKTVNSS